MKNLNIVGKRNIFFIISAILIVISLGSLLIKGLNFGIDFKGGTIIEIDMGKSFETSEIRAITDTFDKSAAITYAGEDRSKLIINTQQFLDKAQTNELFEKFKEKFDLADGDFSPPVKVSAAIGDEVKKQSLLASGIAILLMMLYIWFRFELDFGLAAVLALAHDVIIVLGVYAITGIEVNSPFIAAILTILGYSVNDTIVVFDRIRENRSKYKKSQLMDLVNDSVDQTMGRSINTTITTLLAISALYVMGVQTIQEFALPLIVGFISGSYSSIFISNSFWYVLQERKLKKASLSR